MAENHLTSPFLQPHRVILTGHDTNSASEPLPQLSPECSSTQSHGKNYNHHDGSHEDTHLGSSNPFRFLGCEELSVPPPTTVDPFHNDTPEIDGVYEWIKIVVCLPIALVRLVLFALSVLVGYTVTKLALGGWKDKQNPMPRWRCRLMWVTRFCARCILFSFGYQWIKRRGRPAPRETAPIVVSNHLSYIEPIFYFYDLFPTIVASESHDSMPFVGTIIRAMQVIYVDRFSPSSRKQVVKDIKRRVSCDKFPQVLIFPEGTTTNGKNLISFQLGAFLPGYPVQPVIVRYPHVHFDQSWSDVSLGKLFFRMLTQFHNFFEVEYLPVISPLDDKKESAVHFAERTSHAIATALNVVQTEHSYGDSILHLKAQQAKQEKPSSYLVEMARVESLFHISNLEAADWLDKFLSMNPDPSARVQCNDFLRVLKLKACPISKEIFAFIDVEKNDTITFRQFLYGSVHVLKQPLFCQACELAFAECGGVVKDCIVEQELRDFIQTAIPGWKEDEVHELFVLFDHDNNGRVSKNDFLSCLRKNPLLIALFMPHLEHKYLLGGSGALEIVW